jgi:hypothetical protein
MKAIAGVYLKAFVVFVVSGITCAIIIWTPLLLLILLSSKLRLIDITAPVQVGAAIGGWAALNFGSQHILAIKKRGFSLTAENLNVAQSKTLIVGYDFDAAVARCMTGLRLLKNIFVEPETSETTGTIRARTRRKWEIGGEIIRLQVRSRSEQSTYITLSCRPVLFWIPFDDGRCLQAATTVVDFLQGKHEVGAADRPQKASR